MLPRCRPGQVVIGAVNGVGINTVPSGDFALEVYGGIRSTDPSPIGVSDIRVKDEAVRVNTSECLATVLALQPKDFQYIDGFRLGFVSAAPGSSRTPLLNGCVLAGPRDAPKTGTRPGGKTRGFLAQSVGEVLPSAVFHSTWSYKPMNQDGHAADVHGLHMLDLGPITVEMIGAVQVGDACAAQRSGDVSVDRLTSLSISRRSHLCWSRPRRLSQRPGAIWSPRRALHALMRLDGLPAALVRGMAFVISRP